MRIKSPPSLKLRRAEEVKSSHVKSCTAALIEIRMSQAYRGAAMCVAARRY